MWAFQVGLLRGETSPEKPPNRQLCQRSPQVCKPLFKITGDLGTFKKESCVQKCDFPQANAQFPQKGQTQQSISSSLSAMIKRRPW